MRVWFVTGPQVNRTKHTQVLPSIAIQHNLMLILSVGQMLASIECELGPTFYYTTSLALRRHRAKPWAQDYQRIFGVGP